MKYSMMYERASAAYTAARNVSPTQCAHKCHPLPSTLCMVVHAGGGAVWRPSIAPPPFHDIQCANMLISRFPSTLRIVKGQEFNSSD